MCVSMNRFQKIYGKISGRDFRPGPRPEAVRRRRRRTIFAGVVQNLRVRDKLELRVHRRRSFPIGQFRSIVNTHRQSQTEDFVTDLVGVGHRVPGAVDDLLPFAGERYAWTFGYDDKWERDVFPGLERLRRP